MGVVYGASYEMPEIALRAVLLVEAAIDLEIPTTAGAVAGAAVDGTSTWNWRRDYITFSSGIADDTLLFGSIRSSRWEDNQVFVPTAGVVQLNYQLLRTACHII